MNPLSLNINYYCLLDTFQRRVRVRRDNNDNPRCERQGSARSVVETGMESRLIDGPPSQ